MSIRVAVARVMMADTDDAPLNQWNKANPVTKAIYLSNADAAIATFLEAAAEQGWRMVPEEVTEEMVVGGCRYGNMGDMAGRYRAMLAAAPKFEVNK